MRSIRPLLSLRPFPSWLSIPRLDHVVAVHSLRFHVLHVQAIDKTQVESGFAFKFGVPFLRAFIELSKLFVGQLHPDGPDGDAADPAEILLDDALVEKIGPDVLFSLPRNLLTEWVSPRRAGLWGFKYVSYREGFSCF